MARADAWAACCGRFSMDAMSSLVHLTNIAIQKKEPNSDAYKHSGEAQHTK